MAGTRREHGRSGRDAARGDGGRGYAVGGSSKGEADEDANNQEKAAGHGILLSKTDDDSSCGLAGAGEFITLGSIELAD